MTKEELKETKEDIKSRIKTMQSGEWYTFYIKGSFFDIFKRNDGTFLVSCDELLSELLEIKVCPKEELITAMINEIEKEPIN